MEKEIKRALLSVYNKEGLHEIVMLLHQQGVELYSTGGTQEFIKKMNVPVVGVETVTGYPEILGGRVKTLHPNIFGGLLRRDESEQDRSEMLQHRIPPIDLVVVDLYPFTETVQASASHDEVIEKIDIGGVALIRAAAKNYKHVLVVPSRNQYGFLTGLLQRKKNSSSLEERKTMAVAAFDETSNYDAAILAYLSGTEAQKKFTAPSGQPNMLRYGENPHQHGVFYGNLEQYFRQLHGKELSYNNLLDIEAAILLIREFEEPTCAILKHNNACGCASDNVLLNAWNKALEADPVSAFGGILIFNRGINREVAVAMDKLFFEVALAPSFDSEARQVLTAKKNRILLELKDFPLPEKNFRSWFQGVLQQDRDHVTDTPAGMKPVTNRQPTLQQMQDLAFAMKVAKHTRSNTIVLAKNKQLLGSGTGQTSRIDALHHAIEKAKRAGLALGGSSMASDAFFPFPDCVEEASKHDITSVVQPGGSVRDKESIDFCNNHNMAMVFTGVRHFRH